MGGKKIHVHACASRHSDVQHDVPRGREPDGEVCIRATVEVLGVAERVVVDPDGAEDGMVVPPPASCQAELP
jgi:hypothetical protein